MKRSSLLIEVSIKGVTPLLMNRFPDEDPQNRATGNMRGEKGTPREQAEPKVYKMSDGTLYIPGPNIYSGMIEAGKFHKIGKRQVTTIKSSLIPAGIFLLDTECSLGTSEFEVDSRPVVNPSTGGRVMCHRPRLDVWGMTFTIQVETEEFTEDFARVLLDDMGKKIGLGDFRPQRKGPFGRFVVTRWEVQK